MQSFKSATLADGQFDEETTDKLFGLRESISYALSLYDEQFRYFEQNGLTHDVLIEHDDYLKYDLNFGGSVHGLQSKDLDILIPFVFNMGKAYSQLMADSLVTNPNNGGTTAIEYAGKLSPLLNYFYAQKAKLYPTAMNEPSF